MAKKWIQKAIKREGALKAYASKHGGIDKDGNIKKEWARALQRRLRNKENKSKADTRLLRQLNLFLGVLSKGGGGK